MTSHERYRSSSRRACVDCLQKIVQFDEGEMRRDSQFRYVCPSCGAAWSASEIVGVVEGQISISFGFAVFGSFADALSAK